MAYGGKKDWLVQGGTIKARKQNLTYKAWNHGKAIKIQISPKYKDFCDVSNQVTA